METRQPQPIDPFERVDRADDSFAWRLRLRADRRAPKARRSFLDSVACAWEGLRYAFRTQRNLRVQSAIGSAAILASLVLRLPAHQVALVVALTALVLFAELMNTAVEATLDFHVGSEFDPSVKAIKDTAAASVLVVSLGAAVLGATIFLPALAHGFSQ